MNNLANAYERLLLSRPGTVLIVLASLLAFFAYGARDFRLEASADSLLLEDDEDLQLLREVNSRYQTQDLLIVTFTPRDELFSDASLSQLRLLRDELSSVESVDSVLTLLDAPLVTSSDLPLAQMAENVQTLESPGVDRERARLEFTTSPVYKDLVLSEDARTTGLLVYLEGDDAIGGLQIRRGRLLAQRRAGALAPEERRELSQVSAELRELQTSLTERRRGDIQAIRSILDGHRGHADLHLGGLPMIADDMVTFVRNDLVVFGSGALLLLIAVLVVIFREPRWVLLPLLACFYVGLTMIGLLGWIGWEVTVISSNFLALLLIITISMNIHLAVRYRQLLYASPDQPQTSLVSTALRRMVWPCLYTALTTIIGFSSLVFSNIKPVIDFGWMMSVGLAVTFLVSFSLFPALLLLMGKPDPGGWRGRDLAVMAGLASFTERHGTAILASSLLLAVLAGLGISRLTVENSFIDYFKRDTEIYQGMKLIDEKLGGTTPLQVLLNLDTGGFFAEEDPGEEAAGEVEEDEFEDWDIDVAAGPEYWFTPFKIERIKQVHDYLDGQPEVGKVLSLASGVRVAEQLNDGKEFDGLELSLLYKQLPDPVREALIDPYFSFEHNEARVVLRILDSKPGLRRQELLERIRHDLGTELGLSEGEVTVAGTLVLYNNMLQSLYTSQISSLGAVMVGIGIMLVVLFRSLRLAVIGIVPNLLSAGVVLGLMGLAGIPLDIMTITVAAITIGIAVDNAIHYTYRFREEFQKTGDYNETLQLCHSSIGRAILYTSSTIIIGFSILVLSNFFPTIYFGALTGLAMGIALLAALTLLPRLLLLWKPFGTPS